MDPHLSTFDMRTHCVLGGGLPLGTLLEPTTPRVLQILWLDTTGSGVLPHTPWYQWCHGGMTQRGLWYNYLNQAPSVIVC